MKKKVLLGLMVSVLSFGAFAEQVDFSGSVTTSCAFSNYTGGVLTAHTGAGNYYLDAQVYGSGSASSVDITYSGAPTFTITGASSLDSAPNGTPNINQFSTGISFSDALNNAAAITAGAANFNGGLTKTFQLDDTNVSQDTALVKFAARAATPFPVGNYTSHVVVTCQ